MDAKGVSRASRSTRSASALNQGEIFFDNVRLSGAPVTISTDAVYAIHTFANALMGTVFTGRARSAYELALDYAHERKVGACRSTGTACSTCSARSRLRVR